MNWDSATANSRPLKNSSAMQEEMCISTHGEERGYRDESRRGEKQLTRADETQADDGEEKLHQAKRKN